MFNDFFDDSVGESGEAPNVDSWLASEKKAWYVGRNQKLADDFGIDLLAENSQALQLAKNGDPLHNLTWAINGDELHTWKTQKVVFERLKDLGSKAAIENELLSIGQELAQGKKLF